MKRFLAVLVLALIGFTPAQTYTSSEDLMKAVDALPEPKSVIATMTMTVTSGSGQSLSQQLETWGVTDDEVKQVSKFTAPADIAGAGFLSVEDAAGNSEGLLWLPALGRTRRIAGSDQEGAFFGSDFTYEDVEGVDYAEWTHELTEYRDSIYVVTSTPNEGVETAYERLVFEIPEANLLPTRTEYYQGGELIKTMTVENVEQVGEYILPTLMRMETLKSGSYTVIEQGDYRLDEAIPDEVFSERFLRR